MLAIVWRSLVLCQLLQVMRLQLLRLIQENFLFGFRKSLPSLANDLRDLREAVFLISKPLTDPWTVWSASIMRQGW